MVISDNDTRWNSTYLSMERALTLKAKIRVYSEDHKDELGEDFITLDDRDVIRELRQDLEPFWELTIDLQSQPTDGTHGAIWEALPAIEYLLRHLERLKESALKQKRRIRECVMNSWSLLQKYYNLTDKNHGIYACATLLNPGVVRGIPTLVWWRGADHLYSWHSLPTQQQPSSSSSCWFSTCHSLSPPFLVLLLLSSTNHPLHNMLAMHGGSSAMTSIDKRGFLWARQSGQRSAHKTRNSVRTLNGSGRFLRQMPKKL